MKKNSRKYLRKTLSNPLKTRNKMIVKEIQKNEQPLRWR